MIVTESKEPLIQKALQIARNAHEGQHRKYHTDQLVPYVTHCIRVAQKVLDCGFGDGAVAAAVLHDVFEDCEIKWRSEVANECGAEVYVMVHELTNPSKDVGSPRAVRKLIDRYHIASATLTVRNIKLADRADNLIDIAAAPGAPKDFIKQYIRESEDLLAMLCGGEERIHKRLYDEYRAGLEKCRQIVF